MTLFVLALAYIVGVWIGSLLVWARLPGCDMPNWLSMVPLALLLFTPLLNGTPIVDDEPLRWPERAGFVRPRRGIPRGGGGSGSMRVGRWAADGDRTASRLSDTR